MSDDQDDASKTEDPSQKKLDEARKRGQVPVSREVNNWVMLSAGTLVILAMGPGMMKGMLALMRTYIEQAGSLPEMPGGMKFVVAESFKQVANVIGLPLLFMIVAAFAGPFLQTGPMFAPEVISFDFSKISPIKGFHRLFSMRSIIEFIKGLLKLSIVTVVGLIILKPFYGGIEHMVGLPIPLALNEIDLLVRQLMIGILVVLFIVAAADLVYQRHEHMRNMRMTKQEVKEEYKQSEGDPLVKSKLRQMRQERARQRMMQNVPGADVIITNPTHYSVALKYDPDANEAPMVVAKGLNEVALRIRKVARENDIIILPNPPLARILFDTVDIDEAVPPEHYKAVAEVISYVFKLKGRLK